VRRSKSCTEDTQNLGATVQISVASPDYDVALCVFLPSFNTLRTVVMEHEA